MTTYGLAYFFWVTVHVQRSYWSMSKTDLLDEDKGFNNAFFGRLDFTMFLAYSICQFLTASIADTFDKNKVLTFSYGVQALCFLALGFNASSQILFYAAFVVVGLTQSIVFPCLVSIIGSWFSKKTRGAITGSWATCTNLGNIIG